MLKDLMEEKRLDFSAPLMSVRRFHSSISSATAAKADSKQKPTASASIVAAAKAASGSRTSSLPFYKSDLKSGPVRSPGVVPFEWEQTPGLPRSRDGSFSGEQAVAAATSKPPTSGKVESKSTEPDFGNSNLSIDPQKIEDKQEVTGSDVPNRKRSQEQKPAVEEERQGRKNGDADGTGEEADDAFSDALDAMSHAESCFMNCSISGLTGMPNAAGPSHPGSYFSTDPQARDFMMGRFLPAAQAVATGPSYASSRRPAASAREATRREEKGNIRRPTPLPYQHQPKYPPLPQIGDEDSDDDDDDGDDDYDDARHFPIKGCGFLPKFCLRAPFSVMNPIPGMRVRGRTRVRRQQFRPEIKQQSNTLSSVGLKDEAWEAVYRHKLNDRHQITGKDGSKLTSESYQLTYWSDSQSADGSSPYRRSTGDGISPYRNNAPPSPFHEGKDLLGFPERDVKAVKAGSFDSGSGGSDRYLEMRPRFCSKSGSGSRSPVSEKTLYIDSVHKPETPVSKSSSASSKIFLNPANKNSETAAEIERVEEIIVLEDCEESKPIDAPETHRTDSAYSVEGSNSEEKMNTTKELRDASHIDNPEPQRSAVQSSNTSNKSQSLLPPPLPKSPTESWLWRTLPSVSSKNPGSQSILGIQYHSNKKGIQTFPPRTQWDPVVKASNAHSGQIRFAEILAKPVNDE